VAGHALEFATNSLVVVPHDNALNPGITNTISIWVKPSGYGAPGPNFTPLLSKGDGYYNGYALLLTDTGKIIFQAGAAYGGSLASARGAHQSVVADCGHQIGGQTTDVHRRPVGS
jgi:hypothetical protein